ncbi:hypothetical protein [Spirosoma panaciterrae]|uniref:hypothetical protein n=1 Tax=Spirosoma panaciterrae TaxID=496058 RepID=UPI001FDF17F0|nr:hypothetical protein [Spirosoma panaciterrae]
MLSPPAVIVDHISGVYNVVKEMKNTAINRPTYTVVGIVDKDVTYKPERKPAYFDDFQLEEVGDRLTYGRKPGTNQHLILVDKAIESFLLWNAEKVRLDVTLYDFSASIKVFCKQVKSTTISSDPNYIQLLTDLHALKAPGFLTLERILNDFIVT